MDFNQRAAALKSKSIAFTLIPAICVWAALAYSGRPNIAVAGAGALYVMTTAVSFFWDLRGRSWFWYAIAAIVAVHILAIAKIALSDVALSTPLLPFLFCAMALDFGVIYFAIRFMENLPKP